MEHVCVDTSPLTQDSLSILRDKNTDTHRFRLFADRIAFQLLSFALKESDLQTRLIETPLVKAHMPFLRDNFVFVTILRAGLSMLPAALQIMPQAPVGFLGLRRDEQTAIAQEYYRNLPQITHDAVVIIGDPMLATGGSMLHTLGEIAAFSPKEIRIVSVVCAPEGIEKIRQEYKETTIYTAAIDEKLNDKKYIIPGLGDFGDRYFGTENLG